MILAKYLSPVVISYLLLSKPAFADANHDTNQIGKASAINHAPIAVMADHLHQKGEWMVSYRYMDMEMSGLLSSDKSISLNQALDQYMMVPRSMTMKMHMLGMMYAPNDSITLMLMTNYLDNEMSSTMRMMHNSGMGSNMGSGMHSAMNSDMGMSNMMMPMETKFSTASSGQGDTRFAALIDGLNGENYRSHFTIGVNLPTGDIDQKDQTPMMDDSLLGYSMQLGTGSYHLFGAYTWVLDVESWQIGSQLNYETALNDNDQDYQVGDKLLWHNWFAYSLSEQLSLSVRLSFLDKDNYSGSDGRLNPMMMPTADANMRGGQQIDTAIGANFVFHQGFLKGHRLALEYSMPIEQKVDGIQMETDGSLLFGWQYAF